MTLIPQTLIPQTLIPQTLAPASRILIAAPVVAVLLAAGPAVATPVYGPVHGPVHGVAVHDTDPPTPVVTTGPDGAIPFFIPLGGSGVFGVDGVGLTSDVCRGPCGGRLEMILMFVPPEIGLYQLTLEFDDLDIGGARDSSDLLETVRIFDQGGSELAFVNHIDDDAVTFANTETQVLRVSTSVTSDESFYRLVFESELTARGAFRNTVESLRASLSFEGPLVSAANNVGAPGSLALLAVGTVSLVVLLRARQPASVGSAEGVIRPTRVHSPASARLRRGRGRVPRPAG